MIDKTIEKIEKSIQKIDHIEDSQKSDLLNLVTTLKGELDTLPQESSKQAQSLAEFVEANTGKAAIKEEKVEPTVLESAIKEFEVSHPKLVEAFNQICMMLSNSGI